MEKVSIETAVENLIQQRKDRGPSVKWTASTLSDVIQVRGWPKPLAFGDVLIFVFPALAWNLWVSNSPDVLKLIYGWTLWEVPEVG